MISMPLSSGSFSSSSVRPARPPPNSVLNVSWKLLVDGGERLGEALARRLVDALDRFAGLRDRIDQVLALRGEERVARLELVELLDGHHVHRTEPIDLAAQRRDRLFGAQRPLRRFLDRRLADRQPLTADSAGASSSSSGSSAQITGGVGRRLAVALHLLDLEHDVVERGLDGVVAGVREVRRGRLRRWRARCRARTTTARRPSSEPRASLIAASCASARRAQRRDGFVERHHRLTQRVERRGRRLRAGRRPPRSPRAGRRPGGAIRRARRRATRHAARARPPLPRGAALRRRARARARPARRARRPLRPPGGSGPRPLRALRTGAAAPAVSRSSASR